MPRHKGLPRPLAKRLDKQQLLKKLSLVDSEEKSRNRVLLLETEFRKRILTHVGALPLAEAKMAKFNTNPFVLMIHCFNQGYCYIRQIEHDILPAKVFMSMETSAGRMVESVALPIYGWDIVPSQMHSTDSVLDGKQLLPTELRLATLKSGPRCLNDEMSKDIAYDIVKNCESWARAANVSKIDFTYGVLYGTKKISNKKDWHILRNIDEKLRELDKGNIVVSPENRWDCCFELNGIEVSVTIRIGVDLWNHIAGHDLAFTELCVALIRACVRPGEQESGGDFTIADLAEIISLDSVPNDFNVSILQRSQLEWLFFFAKHFCDELTEN